MKRFKFFLILFLSLPAVAADTVKPDLSIVDRLRILEMVSQQVSREAELTLNLYQMAMNMAIEEAKVEFQSLRSSQFVQQCSFGIDRPNTCLIAWKEATRILDAAFERRNVAGTQNKFRSKLAQIADVASRSGDFAPLRSIDRGEGIVNFVLENRRLKKCLELQQVILEPIRSMVERSANERADVVWLLVNSLDGAQADLNRAKIDPSRESKSSLYNLLTLRNLGQPGF